VRIEVRGYRADTTGELVMNKTSRRNFIANASLGVAAGILSQTKLRASTSPDSVRIGVIGCGNQGSNHIKCLSMLSDAKLAYVADIDSARRQKAVAGRAERRGLLIFAISSTTGR
jgi:ornithine cyclodeaminase/alanine dehydrogenase-like protein (mu-crystallin family)